MMDKREANIKKNELIKESSRMHKIQETENEDKEIDGLQGQSRNALKGTKIGDGTADQGFSEPGNLQGINGLGGNQSGRQPISSISIEDYNHPENSEMNDINSQANSSNIKPGHQRFNSNPNP